MADYYTLASFQIPCTPDQAEIALEGLGMVDGWELDRSLLEPLMKDGDSDLSAKEIIAKHCMENHPDYDYFVQKQTDELEWQFYASADDDGIWIRHDESINTEHAAIFTQAVLKAFDLPNMVEIKAAHTCGKPRLDAFGGHAAVVTKDGISWCSLHDFLEKERTAHERGNRFFFCTLTKVNGQYEYDSHFLMQCGADEDADAKLEHIMIGYRGEGKMTEDGYVECGDGMQVNFKGMTEIDPVAFATMNRFLVIL